MYLVGEQQYSNPIKHIKTLVSFTFNNQDLKSTDITDQRRFHDKQTTVLNIQQSVLMRINEFTL